MATTMTTSPIAARLDELTAEIAEVDAQMQQPPRRGESPADRARLRWRKELLELVGRYRVVIARSGCL